jgi:hypothetical protein
VRDGKDPTAAHPAAQGIADRDRIARHDSAEKGEGADAVSLPRCRADVFAVRQRHGDVGDEIGQFRLQVVQQRVVRRRVGGIGGDRMAEADHEVLEIAEMVIDLSCEDASVAECTIERLGLLGAGLIPQAGADQDQEREHGRRHQTQQLRADPRFQHHDCSDRPCLRPPGSMLQVEAGCVPRYGQSVRQGFSARHRFA